MGQRHLPGLQAAPARQARPGTGELLHAWLLTITDPAVARQIERHTGRHWRSVWGEVDDSLRDPAEVVHRRDMRDLERWAALRLRARATLLRASVRR
ncbi:hypothetical protein OG749_02860 [Streptomyces nojiriensis]|uniref:hypothetical protein n=1 Tax=Streptomyces nojiriensis TaxID=66374 RepID=UPI002E170D0D